VSLNLERGIAQRMKYKEKENSDKELDKSYKKTIRQIKLKPTFKLKELHYFKALAEH
jgi:hypothetical protein